MRELFCTWHRGESLPLFSVEKKRELWMWPFISLFGFRGRTELGRELGHTHEWRPRSNLICPTGIQSCTVATTTEKRKLAQEVTYGFSTRRACALQSGVVVEHGRHYFSGPLTVRGTGPGALSWSPEMTEGDADLSRTRSSGFRTARGWLPRVLRRTAPGERSLTAPLTAGRPGRRRLISWCPKGCTRTASFSPPYGRASLGRCTCCSGRGMRT
mmetsp:Transcript_21853/g.47972  ORF Transcript_21853/g.47972 Transcript_21853/m.47972 type:complete len:214 (+) Transcript_21853:429-1070(+)